MTRANLFSGSRVVHRIRASDMAFRHIDLLVREHESMIPMVDFELAWL